MPITQSAHKALRQSRRRRIFNLRIKRRLKDALRHFRSQPNASGLKQAYKIIDVSQKKRLIHANKASRLKSQAAKILTAAKSPKSKKAK